VNKAIKVKLVRQAQPEQQAQQEQLAQWVLQAQLAQWERQARQDRSRLGQS
jgi:hypothetical protein